MVSSVINSSSYAVPLKHTDWIAILDRDTPLTEERAYLVSNEVQREATHEKLKSLPQIPNGLHVGVSLTENYNFILSGGACAAILVDICKNVHEVHDDLKKMILRSRNCDEFIETLKEYMNQNSKKLNGCSKLKHLLEEINMPHSWLRQKGFEKIQSMYKAGRILHTHLDITNIEGAGIIKRWMQENQLELRTFYVSNVAEGFFYQDVESRQSMKKIQGVIRLLQGRNTAVIDSSPWFTNIPQLAQSVALPSNTVYDPRQARLNGFQKHWSYRQIS